MSIRKLVCEQMVQNFVSKGEEVKQCDPLSPNLFNRVLQQIFKPLKLEGKGIKVQDCRLNNLRFADDSSNNYKSL